MSWLRKYSNLASENNAMQAISNENEENDKAYSTENKYLCMKR
jgi:hypothetical protein